MLKGFEDRISECSISFDKVFDQSGYFDFALYFYSDSDSNTLYKTITLEGNESRWFIEGSPIVDSFVYENNVLLGVLIEQDSQYNISYQPDKDDKIFDTILYVKLHSVLNEEVV